MLLRILLGLLLCGVSMVSARGEAGNAGPNFGGPPVMKLVLPSDIDEGGPSKKGKLVLQKKTGSSLTIIVVTEPPGRLLIPPVITVPAGAKSVQFPVRAPDNKYTNGPLPVLVAYGTKKDLVGFKKVIVNDNDMKFKITVPKTLLEGTTRTGTLTVPFGLGRDFPIRLSAGPGSEISIPSSVTMGKGKRSVTFPIKVADDDVPSPSRSVTISVSADGYLPGSVVMPITDNDPFSYRFTELPDFVTGKTIPLVFTALDESGQPLATSKVPVSVFLVMRDGSTVPTVVQDVVPADGGWSGSLAIPAGSDLPKAIRVVDKNGTTSDSAMIDSQRVLNVPAADMAWDKTRGRIYASVPAAVESPHANKILVIDPATGEVTASIPVTGDPARTVLTSDDKYLYVSMLADKTINQYDPDDFSLVRSFGVGSHPTFGESTPGDIATVAGSPDLLVVGKYRGGPSNFAGVAVYDQGVALPDTVDDFLGTDRIEPSADPSVFFGYNSQVSSFDFVKFKVDAGGIRKLATNHILRRYKLDFRSAGDLLCTDDGTVVNGPGMRILGSLGSEGDVLPEPGAGRIYQLATRSSSVDLLLKLVAYDADSLLPLRESTFSKEFYDAKGLLRWGEAGLAFRSKDSIVILGAESLVPSGPATDLAATITSSASQVAAGQEFSYQVTAANHGPETADASLVNVTLSDSLTALGISTAAGQGKISGKRVSWNAGSIAPGAAVTLTIRVKSAGVGSTSCLAVASSTAKETDISNNRAFRVVNAGFAKGADKVNVLKLGASQVIRDPVRPLLWAAISANSRFGPGRSIVSINPQNGTVSDPIHLSANPSAMAISGNGAYLYVGFTDASFIQRIRLADRVPDLVIPLWHSDDFGHVYAEDIEVLQGDGTSFLVSVCDQGSGIESLWYAQSLGVMVYDGATRRPLTSTGGNRLEPTGDPSVFIGVDASWEAALSTFVVTAEGVQRSGTVTGIISSASDIRVEDGLLVSSTGVVIDTASMVKKKTISVYGKVQLSTARGCFYLATGKTIRAFSTKDYKARGTLNLPVLFSEPYYSIEVERHLGFELWGTDGYAIIDGWGDIYLARWTQPAPAAFAASPVAAAASPAVKAGGVEPSGSAWTKGTTLTATDSVVNGGGATDVATLLGNVSTGFPAVIGDVPVLVLPFQRRADEAGSYRAWVSPDLGTWIPATDLTEVINGTFTRDGAAMLEVELRIANPWAPGGHARLEWMTEK